MPASVASFRSIGVLGFVLAALTLATGARGAGTSPPPREPRDNSQPQMPETGFSKMADSLAAQRVRADAEKSYAKAWQICEEAKKEAASGKGDSAKKKFGKALKKFNEATELDARYYEAWNMVGYCARKSGDLKRSLVAYMKCLEIEPEYAQAHEYLGETYLALNDLAKAKEQLMWLVVRKSDQAGELATKIEAFEKGGTAPPDSTAKGGGW